jgi:hypothetical protein
MKLFVRHPTEPQGSRLVQMLCRTSWGGSWCASGTGKIYGRPSPQAQELANELLSQGGGGQPVHQLGPQHGVGNFLLWGDNDFLHFRCLSMVQLRHYVVDLRSLIADAGQGELCLNLGESHGWPHGNSAYHCWLRATRCFPHVRAPNVVSTTWMFCGPWKGAVFSVKNKINFEQMH